MERGLTHACHSLIIGVISYLLMVYGLNQSQSMAENRSVLVAAFACVYMVAFGHKAPSMNSLNKL
jgi:hypothetical protein